MKRLLILTAAAMLTLSAMGCECCRWCRRGAFLPTAQPDVCCEPACPTYSPCDPCMAPPAISPGPETYVPSG